MILTKPSSITKNSPASFVLNKDELALHPIVSASLLSDSTSWSRIVLAYKSSVGNDVEKVVFGATEATPTKEFLVSEYAQDVFQIQSITIFNMDNGFVVIPRSDLTTSEFDVDTAQTAPLGTAIAWETNAYYTLTANGGITATSSVENNRVKSLISSTSSNQDFIYEFIFNVPEYNDFFGVSNSGDPSSNAGFYGIARNGTGSNSANVHVNGAYLNTQGGIFEFNASENTFTISRTGNNITMKLNGVVISSTEGVPFEAFPVVRIMQIESPLLYSYKLL